MEFGDLNTVAGLQKLNAFLATRSYLEGAAPSAADAAVFAKLAGNPDFINVVRWYTHMSSFSADEKKKWTAAPKEEKKEKKEAAKEDDFELFGEDGEEDEAFKKKKEEAEAAKNAAKKDKPASMSSIIFDCKPWDDETDMKEMEAGVRAITLDGLTWQTSKFVEVAYGVKKLQIGCKVVDDIVSVDEIEEKIMELTDFVQSVDIAAFVKL